MSNKEQINYLPQQQNQKQHFISQYTNFFKFQLQKNNTRSEIFSKISSQLLQYHKISILQQNSLLFEQISKFDDIYISVRKQQYNGLLYLLDIIFGYFHLTIHLLNIQRTADQQDDQIELNKIGKGGFGSVRAVNIDQKQFAIKRIYFKTKLNINPQLIQQHFIDLDTEKYINLQIKKAIRQYSICKICSMLQIGPKIIFNNQFDLICYNDCVQFHMQLCQVPDKSHNFLIQKQISFQKFNNDLKQCLFILHLLKIVHRDIKPQNILYSKHQNKFILADFGLTQIVQQQYWQKTLSTYAGTLKYSSSQMIKLYESHCTGYVNLYMNDVYSLNMILNQWKTLYENVQNIQKQIQNNQLSRNSMSFVQSFSNNHTYEYNQQQYYNKNSNNFNNQDQYQCSLQSRYQQQLDLQQQNNNSIIHTSSSIPLLPTNNTNTILGPMRYSSEINFYQSKLIYYIFINYLNNPQKKLTLETLRQIIENQVNFNQKDEIIKFQLIEHLSFIFFPEVIFDLNKQQQKLVNAKQLFKNMIRIYGSQANQTKNVFKIIVQLQSQNHQLLSSKQNQIQKYLFSQKQYKQQHSINLKQFNINKILKNSLNSIKNLIKSLQNFIVEIKKQDKIINHQQFYLIFQWQSDIYYY